MTGRNVAAGIAVAGVVGLGLLACPAGAGAQPELPPVTPEALVQSVIDAKPGPFNGTVELRNELGLPALPDVPQAANGTSTARIWFAGGGQGDRRGRVALPTPSGERTIVSDGTTLWSWNSDTRTVTTRKEDSATPSTVTPTDPAKAAGDLINKLRSTSTLSVDGTAEVAGRPAYELVLAPAPTERTLLREVRVAVDAQARVPLRLTVLANGSADPALQLGFTDLTFGPQDPALFTFTPPPGATVEQAPTRPDQLRANTARTVGDGWDTVVVLKRPAPDAGAQAPDLSRLGTPVSGSWGSGRMITTTVATAIITDDGRIAFGAAPEQVVTEALAQ